jgi:hypothetical protein
MRRLSFPGFYQKIGRKSRGKPDLEGFYSPGMPCYVAQVDVMQSPHKNENLLFKNFEDFLVQRQHSMGIEISRSPMGKPLP